MTVYHHSEQDHKVTRRNSRDSNMEKMQFIVLQTHLTFLMTYSLCINTSTLQRDGAEDQDDAEQAGGEAGGGQEQGQSAGRRQGGDAQAGAGERQAETQV